MHYGVSSWCLNSLFSTFDLYGGKRPFNAWLLFCQKWYSTFNKLIRCFEWHPQCCYCQTSNLTTLWHYRVRIHGSKPYVPWCTGMNQSCLCLHNIRSHDLVVCKNVVNDYSVVWLGYLCIDNSFNVDHCASLANTSLLFSAKSDALMRADIVGEWFTVTSDAL